MVSLLDAILASPDADAPRLVYADSLCDGGDPRGEFIQVQCRLAALADGDPARASLLARQKRLLREHQNAWVAPIRRFLRRWEFHRGFIERVSMDTDKFGAYGRQLLAVTPIRHLKVNVLGSLWPEVGAFASTPELAKIPSLDASNNRLDVHAADALVGPREVRGLRALNLRSNPLRDTGVAILARAANLRRLTLLNLERTRLTGVGVTSLGASETLAGLRTLVLGDPFGDDGALALAAATGLGELRDLRFQATGMTDAGVVALSAATSLPSLERLTISDARLTAKSIRALARTKRARLTTLVGLETCQLGAGDLALLERRFRLEEFPRLVPGRL